MGSFTAPYHPPTNEPPMGAYLLVADRVGFEPTRRFPVHTLSKRAPSATRPPVLTKRRDYSVSPLSSKRERLPLRDFDLQFGVGAFFLAEDQIEVPRIDEEAGRLSRDEHRVHLIQRIGQEHDAARQ